MIIKTETKNSITTYYVDKDYDDKKLEKILNTKLKSNNNFFIINENADVYVCDGFTGNVVLKMAESVYDIVKKRNIEDAYFNRFNFEMYGGVPVLGVSKPVIIGHGVSNHHLAQ